MIFIFRKEVKKWRNVLWLVLAALALGTGSSVFFMPKTAKDIKVASVDGKPVYLHEYQHVLSLVRLQFQELVMTAQQFGLPLELLAQYLGLNNPEQKAMQEAIASKLLAPARKSFGVVLDEEYVDEKLLSDIKRIFPHVTEDVYKNLVRQLGFTVREFEQAKERDYEQQVLYDVVKEATYVPRYVLRADHIKNSLKKSFTYFMVPLEKFVDEVKKKEPSSEVLADYFKENKESYRVPEKRKAEFWHLSLDDYLKDVSLTDEAIEGFYAKHQHNRYRIPPKVKVRRITFAVSDDASEKERDKVKEKAQEVRKQIMAKPAIFAEMAKKHSAHSSAKKGGLTDFFRRGADASERQFEDAAFALKETGEISSVVSTDQGFEIIELVDRIAASSKPLDKVRDDVVETLKKKKAQNKLLSDVRTVLHEARSNPEALASYVGKRGLKSTTSEWLTKEEGASKTKMGLLGTNLFSKRHGYFEHANTYVLYRESDREKSHIPELKAIKSQVLSAYYTKKAKERAKAHARELKRELVTKKAPIAAVAQKNDYSLKTTDMVRKDAKIDNLEKVSGLTARMFDLTDPSQILKFKHEGTYYFVQLVKEETVEEQEFEKLIPNLASAAREEQKALYQGGFIASLARNAKIETFDEEIKRATVRPEY